MYCRAAAAIFASDVPVEVVRVDVTVVSVVEREFAFFDSL